jgi:hypothetical protein
VAKADTKTSESKPASTESSSADAAEGAAAPKTDSDGAKPKKDPPRPASYFSSVRSDEYRQGWDSVFGKTKAPPRRRNGPLTLELSGEDLSEREFAALLAAAKRKARGRRVSVERAAKNGELSLSIVCRIGRGRSG